MNNASNFSHDLSSKQQSGKADHSSSKMLGGNAENKDNTIVQDKKEVAVAFRSDGFKQAQPSPLGQTGVVVATQEEGDKAVQLMSAEGSEQKGHQQAPSFGKHSLKRRMISKEMKKKQEEFQVKVAMGILLATGVQPEPKKTEHKPLLSDTFHPRSKDSLEK